MKNSKDETAVAAGRRELAFPLPNGGTLRCGEGDDCQWGGHLRICDPGGNEILYWDHAEWEEDGAGEGVIGACFAAAMQPLHELLRNRRLRHGVWVLQPWRRTT